MDLSKLDPDWKAAALHGLSTLPGIATAAHGKEIIMCPCCLNVVDKERAPLCQNSKELQFLGFGFPLFYIFLKYCILLLMASIASYNAVTLYWALLESQDLCQELENGCNSFMVVYAEISGKVTNGAVVVRVFSFIIQLGMLLYIRDLITKTRNYYDERTCSLSDYSVLVTNLPKKKGTRKNLENFLSTYLDKPYKAYEVTFLPEYEEFYKMEDEKEAIIEQMRPLLADQQGNKQAMAQLEKELENKQQELVQYCDRELKMQQNDQCLTEKLIFSCWTEDEKCSILEGFEDMSQEKLRQAFHIPIDDQCAIEFKDAPQPKEINWQHINEPDHKRVVRMIIGWMMTSLFLLTITFLFFFLLSEKSTLIEHAFQDKGQGNDKYFEGLFLVYFALVCVILFNKFIMGAILHRICDLQRHPTTDQQQFHFALKYSVGMFFTTAIMTLAVEDMRFNNFFSRPYGVIEEETLMFFMNAFFVPFIWMINPWQLGVLIKRKFNQGRKDLTQKQANKMMENIQYNMGKRYAEIAEIMWFTFLYSSLIPMGAFLSTIGLCLYYWVDKYNLLRRSSVNSAIAGELSLLSMKLLDFTLLCKPIGEIIFDSQIRDSYCITSIIMSAVAILYLMLPIDDFLNYFHPERFKTEERNFEQAQRFFKDTYQTLHPIFSLKMENQKKMYKSFQRGDTGKMNLKVDQRDHHVEIESIGDFSASKKKPKKDATNILKALFRKHVVLNPHAGKVKEKENNQNEQWN